jgi:hypothetical protein
LYGNSYESNLEVNMKMVKSLILGSAAGLIAMGRGHRRPIFP